MEYVASAKDQNGSFIFKHPHNITTVDDGSFFLIDAGNVLKFNPDCSFSKTIVRRGQGPTEATHLNQLYRMADTLVVNTGFMAKLMAFDFDGSLKWEHTQKNSIKILIDDMASSESTYQIIGHNQMGNLIVMTSLSNRKKKSDENLIQCNILSLSQENQWQKKLMALSVDAYVVKTPLGYYSIPSYNVLTDFRPGNIFFVNSLRYEIKVYDIKKNEITETWSRPYNPVRIPVVDKEKYTYGGIFMVNYKGKAQQYKAPGRDSFRDIQRMFTVNGQLWVITSTVISGKGVLVDVFNNNGSLIDHFFLSFPPGLDMNLLYRINVAISGNHLYIRQLDEEENYIIVKYRLIGL